jgi:hypothetical protein
VETRFCVVSLVWKQFNSCRVGLFLAEETQEMAWKELCLLEKGRFLIDG